jgi:hypothetical protein
MRFVHMMIVKFKRGDVLVGGVTVFLQYPFLAKQTLQTLGMDTQ